MEKEELDQYFENMKNWNKVINKQFKPNEERLELRIQLANKANTKYDKIKHENYWLTAINDFKNNFLVSDYTKPIIAIASILIVGIILFILINNNNQIIQKKIDKVVQNHTIKKPESSDKMKTDDQDSVLIASQQIVLHDFTPLNSKTFNSLTMLAKLQKEISFGIASKSIDEKSLIDSVLLNICNNLDTKLKFKMTDKFYLSEWFYLITTLNDSIPTRIALENQSKQILIKYESVYGSKISNNSKNIKLSKLKKIRTLTK